MLQPPNLRPVYFHRNLVTRHALMVNETGHCFLYIYIQQNSYHTICQTLTATPRLINYQEISVSFHLIQSIKSMVSSFTSSEKKHHCIKKKSNRPITRAIWTCIPTDSSTFKDILTKPIQRVKGQLDYKT